MSAKKIVLSVLLLALVCLAGFMLAKNRYFVFDHPNAYPITHKNYVIDTDKNALTIAPPSLPDLSGFTLDAIQDKQPRLLKGRVSIVPIEFLTGMEKFTEKRRLVEFSRLQRTPDPTVIAIYSGHYDPESLTREVNNPNYIEKLSDGEYLLKRPLYIDHGASLNIEGTPGDHTVIKMSSVTGGFIVNAGKIFILHADILGWNDEKNEESVYEERSKQDFRPFFTSWSGSESYFYGSAFRNLGYKLSKSYGVSFSTAKSILKKDPSTPPPHGWLINNVFDGVYYGFYSYEAEDVAIIGNTYKDNIIYGIDPHDRSKRLIIAKNKAFGTHKKHGIIVSREVNDSWIFDNVSYRNKGSGFMLDRSSVNNIVANNVAYMNGGDGLTLFESQNNLIYKNTFIANSRSGYRARNSWDVKAYGNRVLFNGGDGIQIYSFDIRETEQDRDFNEDPFSKRATLSMANDMVVGNLTGGFKFNSVDFISLSNVEFGFFMKRFVRGDLDDISRDIAKGLAQSDGTLRFRYDSTIEPEKSSVKKGSSKNKGEEKSDVLDKLDENETPD